MKCVERKGSDAYSRKKPYQKMTIHSVIMAFLILSIDAQADNLEEKQALVEIGKASKAEIVVLFDPPTER
jgi:hypothetical protein